MKECIKGEALSSLPVQKMGGIHQQEKGRSKAKGKTTVKNPTNSIVNRSKGVRRRGSKK